MTRFWLKLIYSSKHPCPETYERSYVHFRKGKPRRIHRGDRMVVYACGGSKHVFALADVTGEVYVNGQEDWPYQVDISYLVKLPVSSGVSINDISTSERNLVRPIQWGASYIELRPEEYERAAALLRVAAGSAENAANQPQ